MNLRIIIGHIFEIDLNEVNQLPKRTCVVDNLFWTAFAEIPLSQKT
jgi:hypothetical protein